MKKKYSLLLAFLVAFSSFFVSCDENDSDSTICKITVVSDGDGDGAVSITNYIGTSVNVLIGNNVEVVATPADGSAFIGWYISGTDAPVSTEARFVFTASENTTLMAKFIKLSNLTLLSSDGGTVSFKGSYGSSVAVLPGTEVTVVANPYKNCDFIGWFIGDAETAVSTDEEYTFVVEKDITLTAKFSTRPLPVGEAIDLGLSVKWASFNVGASKPEDYGGYYAWGETEEKKNYFSSTYKWYNSSYNKMTKYCTVDNKTVLDPQDDVAHIKWGGTWRMPTKAEQDELRNNCTWTWTTRNGVNGYKVTGPNGNSIFLPAAGYCGGADLRDRGSKGDYWSSSLYEGYDYDAYNFGFHSSGYDWDYSGRNFGFSVRPVSK